MWKSSSSSPMPDRESARLSKFLASITVKWKAGKIDKMITYEEFVQVIESKMNIAVRGKHADVERGLRGWFINNFMPVSKEISTSFCMIRLWNSIRRNCYRRSAIEAKNMHLSKSSIITMETWASMCKRYSRERMLSRATQKILNLQTEQYEIPGIQTYGVRHARKIPPNALTGARKISECWGCTKMSWKKIQKISVCGRCGIARYCCTACQSELWPMVHREKCVCRQEHPDLYAKAKMEERTDMFFKVMMPVFLEAMALSIMDGVYTPFFQFASRGRNSINFDIIPLKITKTLLDKCIDIDKPLLKKLCKVSQEQPIQAMVIIWANSEVMEDSICFQYKVVPVPGHTIDPTDMCIMQEYMRNLQYAVMESRRQAST